MSKVNLRAGFTQRWLNDRYGSAVLLVILLVTISMITRLALMIFSFKNVDISVLNFLGIFLLGFLFDIINASYFIIPLLLYLWLIPGRIYNRPWHRFVLYGIFFLFTFILLFNAVSEWFFWDEFNTRFNFIAVDYLVYTNEVLGNIQQSYPITWIILGVIIICIGIVYAMKPLLKSTTNLEGIRFKQRSLLTFTLLLLPVVFFFTINNRLHQFSRNAYANELAGNGMYELFAAYLNNELNYNQFYRTVEDKEAFVKVRELLKTPDATFTSDDPFDLTRIITPDGEEKKLNVVMISVESLSADFLGIFGNKQGITPFMDSLSQHSLLFTNLYATGTRTVRGLEALSLCIPPTPGQSIVRRPNNEHLFSLGKVFNDKGYESKYIYGGYGYFDNMNYFFANNNYTVADRSLLNDNDIDYENVWGVADENLFTLAEREIEKTLGDGKPIFAQVMTTSNHRPFTYPDGRIDIPSHTNREGAVKYTDYAIGKFIKSCSHKPWFNNTLFVIVADHCASSAGKTELPVNKYHIPLMIYSPVNIPAGKMERLMSQIDLGPTLLGLLNFKYTSKFFGYDIYQLPVGRERAFISTYQSLGYLRGDQLVILYPQKKVAEVTPNFIDGSSSPHVSNPELIKEAISWYQSSSYTFREGGYKE
jgi:phosphoglycerol transferase MdoB-like AlkP superfamily enzyme